jgi:hypothetical protein
MQENLLSQNDTNKNTVFNYLYSTLSNGFQNLNKVQVETFCISLFNKIYNRMEFIGVLRDFLISLNTFGDNNDELYLDEKNVSLFLN